MVEYFKDENGKPVNIRKLARGLLHFPVTQGSCSDGENIYMLFERKHKRNCTHRCKIVKLDAKTLAVKKVSDELRTGHGNDMTYRNGVLYITHSRGDMVVHRVDAETLEQLPGVHVTIPKPLKRKRIRAFNGIACYEKGFILRVMGGAGMLITDKNLAGIRYFRTKKNYRVSQGMDQKRDKTYRAYSWWQSEDKNYLAVFNSDGELIERTRLDVSGEMESVFFVKDKLYGTVYKKTGSKERLRFEAYIFTIS